MVKYVTEWMDIVTPVLLGIRDLTVLRVSTVKGYLNILITIFNILTFTGQLDGLDMYCFDLKMTIK